MFFRSCRQSHYNPLKFKAFLPKRGLVFAANGASAPPPPALAPPPLSPGGLGALPKIPWGGGFLPGRGGGGQGCVRGIWGGGGRGRRGPIYRENEPPFRRARQNLPYRNQRGRVAGASQLKLPSGAHPAMLGSRWDSIACRGLKHKRVSDLPRRCL